MSNSLYISVVGGAIASPVILELAEAIGREIGLRGHILITGGLAGVMEAASKGASQEGGRVVGVLPGLDRRTANPWVDTVIPTGLGPARNVIVAQSDVVIGIGGQAGTLSELALAWKLDRLVLGARGAGWAGKLADKPIDDRVRYPGIEDEVFGFDHAVEAIDLAERLAPAYRSRPVGAG